MREKNLILSLVCAVIIPILECNAINKDMRDEVQLQPERVSTEAGVMASEAVLAVPADVKWAHRLATGFAVLGAIAGVAQLWYIGKDWGEGPTDLAKEAPWYSQKGEVLTEWRQASAGFQEDTLSRDICRNLHNDLSTQYLCSEGLCDVIIFNTNALYEAIIGGMQEKDFLGVKSFRDREVSENFEIKAYFKQNEKTISTTWKAIIKTQWVPNKETLKTAGVWSGIRTSMFALAAGWLYCQSPVITPAAASSKTIAEAVFATEAQALVMPFSMVMMVACFKDIAEKRFSKDSSFQEAAFWGMILCKSYTTFRLWSLNDKAAAALATPH